MSVRQQIIESRVERIAQNLGISEDSAFLYFVHSIMTGQSIYAIDPADIVDGGQDKQLDAITIEQTAEAATVYIIQAKHTDSFSSNNVIQMRNGLVWLFDKPRTDINTLANVKLKAKIFDYRAVQNELGPSNIHVVVAYVTNGLTSHIRNTDEFHQEEKTISDTYDNGTYAKFDLLILGADELVEQLNMLERRGKKIDADIHIQYDRNNPSLIKFYADTFTGMVCTSSADEIARIVNNDPSGAIFDSNIRRFLGTRGNVNKDIYETCTDTNVSYQFWFLNNGITIICDSFDPVTDQDNPHVKIKNMQIVNGCQTASALALAEREGKLARDVRVLLRIYQAPPDLVSQIVLTTNNQNKISSHDLHANDAVQLDMERAFADYDYFYERKPRQYDNVANINVRRIAPNEVVARSYLAIVLKKPSDARAYKYKVWGEFYDQVFGGREIEPYIISWLIYRLTEGWIKQSGYAKDTSNDIRRRLVTSGAFFIARIVSYLWRKGDNWKRGVKYKKELEQQISTLEEKQDSLNDFIEQALGVLETIVRKNYRDIEKALKSSSMNTDIDRYLYTTFKYKY